MKNLQNTEARLNRLTNLLAQLSRAEEIEALLTDLCTPNELAAIADRLHVAAALDQGASYRTIQADSGVSLATITRVARHLKLGSGGYQNALNKINTAKG